MNASNWVRVIGIIGPIVAMLVVGFWLATRSGLAHVARAGAMKRALENFSEAILLFGGCLLGLAAIHQLVGLRVGPIAIW